jgi:hypothetical protein
MAMNDIEIKIPVALIQSWIIRRQAVAFGEDAVDEAAALELAREVIAIVASFRQLLSVAPPYRPHGLPEIEMIEEPDLIDAILRVVRGFLPEDVSQAAQENEWLTGQFSRIHADELYMRFLRVCDAVNNTDLASLED